MPHAQLLEQLSASLLLPSSQTSPFWTTPSPQKVAAPAASWQVAVQTVQEVWP